MRICKRIQIDTTFRRNVSFFSQYANDIFHASYFKRNCISETVEVCYCYGCHHIFMTFSSMFALLLSSHSLLNLSRCVFSHMEQKNSMRMPLIGTVLFWFPAVHSRPLSILHFFFLLLLPFDCLFQFIYKVCFCNVLPQFRHLSKKNCALSAISWFFFRLSINILFMRCYSWCWLMKWVSLSYSISPPCMCVRARKTVHDSFWLWNDFRIPNGKDKARNSFSL